MKLVLSWAIPGVISPRNATLRRYLARRDPTIGRLETDYVHLLQRANGASKLARDVDNTLNRKQLGQLSTFLAVEAEDVIGCYQKLCAQIALAVFSDSNERKKFISYVGYSVAGLAPSPQLWPIVTVVVLQFLTAAIGFGLTSDFAHNHELTGEGGIVLAQGFTMTSAIVLAVAPKIALAWARPSLSSAPTLSYIVFGVTTFFCGIVLFATVVPDRGQSGGSGAGVPIPALAFLLLPPGLFAVSNVVLSWRIDRRILKSCYEFGNTALRNSLCLFVATFIYTIFYRVCIILVFYVSWTRLPNIFIIWAVLCVSALVIGFTVPGWAVNYIYPVRTIPRPATVARGPL